MVGTLELRDCFAYRAWTDGLLSTVEVFPTIQPEHWHLAVSNRREVVFTKHPQWHEKISLWFLKARVYLESLDWSSEPSKPYVRNPYDHEEDDYKLKAPFGVLPFIGTDRHIEGFIDVPDGIQYLEIFPASKYPGYYQCRVYDLGVLTEFKRGIHRDAIPRALKLMQFDVSQASFTVRSYSLVANRSNLDFDDDLHEEQDEKSQARAVWVEPELEVLNTASPTFIYFMQAVTGGSIKIGISDDPNRRLREIQRMSPVKLRILATMPGDYSLETSLHRKFASSHSHGEWFNPTDELLSFIGLIDLPAAAASNERQ